MSKMGPKITFNCFKRWLARSYGPNFPKTTPHCVELYLHAVFGTEVWRGRDNQFFKTHLTDSVDYAEKAKNHPRYTGGERFFKAVESLVRSCQDDGYEFVWNGRSNHRYSAKQFEQVEVKK